MSFREALATQFRAVLDAPTEAVQMEKWSHSLVVSQLERILNAL